MANADCLTFSEMADFWTFCTPALLLHRYERCRAIARSPEEFRIIEGMLTRYIEEAAGVARIAKTEGDEKTAKEMLLVIQRGDARCYSGPIRHGRFQVMESLTPVGTFYVVDHSIPDLLLRENGPGSAVRRYPTREAAEEETDRRAEVPVEITAAARRRGGIDILPSGKGRGIIEQETEDMARPKKAETAPKKAGAVPEKKTKGAAPTPAPVKGKGKTAAAPPAPVAATNGAGKRGAKSLYPDTAKIVVLKKENPCRAGTGHATRYALYRDGMTVADYIAKGGHRGDVAYDAERSFIRVG
jgi:hypothetical protein